MIDSTNVCVRVSSSFQEVAEPLQDLKEGMEQLEKNKTLRYILSTLLSFGNFLNNANVSGDRYGVITEIPGVSNAVLISQVCNLWSKGSIATIIW